MITRGSLFRSIRYARNESGAALIEVSLLFPILVGLMVGAVEYGRVFQQYHVASKGVTAAARYMARIQNPTLCNGGTPGGTWAGDINDAKDLAQRGFLQQGAGQTGNYILPNWDDPTDISILPNCVTNTAPGGVAFTKFRGPAELPRIVVRTTFTYDNLGLFSFINPNGIEITASHTEYYVGG